MSVDVGPLLDAGVMEIEGRLIDASNATFVADLTLDGLTRRCVYKPIRGERPLWDFPTGTLAGREVAARTVSDWLGWHLVPQTVIRDGPFGPGMCQLWIDTDGRELVDLMPLGRVSDGWLRVLDAEDQFGTGIALSLVAVAVGAHLVEGHPALELAAHVSGEQIGLQQIDPGVDEGGVEAFGEHLERGGGVAAGLVVGLEVVHLVDPVRVKPTGRA